MTATAPRAMARTSIRRVVLDAVDRRAGGDVLLHQEASGVMRFAPTASVCP
jgi:hypothetical protein